MTEPTSAQELFKGRHFDREVIVLCVRWYLSFKLSSRDLVQMMSERGIRLAHTTILRWVQRYVPEFENVVRVKFCKLAWVRLALGAGGGSRAGAVFERLPLVSPVETITPHHPAFAALPSFVP